MRCGKGHEHRTVAEVRACYASARTEVPQDLRGGKPTVNQVNFLNSLLEQLGEDEGFLVKPMGELDVLTASTEIDRLLAMRQAQPSRIGGKAFKATHKGPLVPEGTYTVVFEGDLDNYITLRFRSPRDGKWAGTQLVEYLYGPDNTTMYRRFANRAEDEGYRVWGNYSDQSRLMFALTYMIQSDKEQRITAGETYALKSSRCWKCGKDLTRADSITRGMGAICAGKELG